MSAHEATPEMVSSPNESLQTESLQSPYLTPAEAAEYLRITPKALATWRSQGNGKGPDYFKFGSRVAYCIADLDRWANRQRRSGDGEMAAAQVVEELARRVR